MYTCPEVKRSQHHLVAAIENNRLGAPIDAKSLLDKHFLNLVSKALKALLVWKRKIPDASTPLFNLSSTQSGILTARMENK